MSVLSSRNESIVLLCVSVTIALLFTYGVIATPVVSYNLSTVLEYNETWDFSNGGLPIILNLENTGLNPVSLKIAVRYYNSSHPTEDTTEYEYYREMWLTLDESVKVGESRQVNTSMIPEGDHQYIAMLFYPVPFRDLNPVSSFEESFTRLINVRPTAILLKHIEGTVYMRSEGN